MQENHIRFYCKQKAIDTSSDIVIQHANQSSVLYPKNISSGIFIKMKRNSGNIIKKKNTSDWNNGSPFSKQQQSCLFIKQNKNQINKITIKTFSFSVQMRSACIANQRNKKLHFIIYLSSDIALVGFILLTIKN